MLFFNYTLFAADLDYMAEVRQQIPILKQRRSDLYEVKALKPPETT